VFIYWKVGGIMEIFENPSLEKTEDALSVTVSNTDLDEDNEANVLSSRIADENIIVGTSGNDLINGINGESNLIYGLAGDDTIYGGDAGDTIYGGAGNDIIIGGSGDDILYGDAGNDYIDGGAGSDLIYGGDGNDTLHGGTGDDLLFGGDGDDTYIFDLGDGNDLISDTSGDDTVQFTSSVNKSNIAIFTSGSNLVIDYGTSSGEDIITIRNQSTASSAIERFELSDGTFLTNTDINQIIQDMTAFAANNDIDLSDVSEVKNNADLMAIIANSWHT